MTPCGGGATHAAFQPFRAFNMAASAAGIGANLRTGGGSYGNPPLPASYPNVGMNPYGPQFPPPPGPAGPLPPAHVRFAPGPYGEMPPNESMAASAAPAPAKLKPACVSGSNRYGCWPSAAKAALWTSVGVCAFLLALFVTIMVLRRTRRFA